ncbi:hypothetical protein P0Y35_07445 [Kiritimatiellaeota bacterium B1221]|nr:hypothetical protein [Kiritimatiellaeota bacterium B1221]
MKHLRLLYFFLPCGLLFAQNLSPANTHLLKETTIPEITLKNADLREALDVLRELTKTEDLEVNFVISPDVKAEEKVLTFSIRGVSGVDAFATILQMSGTRAEIKRGSIWILPNPAP